METCLHSLFYVFPFDDKMVTACKSYLFEFTSIKEVSGNAFTCFRQVNDSDVLVMLELRIE